MRIVRAIARVLERVGRNVEGARMLAGAGVRTSSILLYPIRRRLPSARTQLDLRGGLSIVGPAEEPLIFLFKEIWVDRCYDRGAALRPDGVIVDIGAHVGLFTLWALAESGGTRVVAVEPSPRAASYLRENVRRNELRSVDVVEAACGGSRRRTRLFKGRSEMQSSIHPTDPRDAGSDEVDVLTLDDLFDRFGIDHCQLLKLDCEGAEYEILYGASRATLERVDRIVMECHLDRAGADPEELAGHLRSLGFELRWGPSDGVHAYLHATRSLPDLTSLEVSREPVEVGAPN